METWNTTGRPRRSAQPQIETIQFSHTRSIIISLSLHFTIHSPSQPPVQDDCERIQALPVFTATCHLPFSPTSFPLFDNRTTTVRTSHNYVAPVRLSFTNQFHFFDIFSCIGRSVDAPIHSFRTSFSLARASSSDSGVCKPPSLVACQGRISIWSCQNPVRFSISLCFLCDLIFSLSSALTIVELLYNPTLVTSRFFTLSISFSFPIRRHSPLAAGSLATPPK